MSSPLGGESSGTGGSSPSFIARPPSGSSRAPRGVRREREKQYADACDLPGDQLLAASVVGTSPPPPVASTEEIAATWRCRSRSFATCWYASGSDMFARAPRRADGLCGLGLPYDKAAVSGHGIALGGRRTVEAMLDDGRLIRPCENAVQHLTGISAYRGTGRVLHPLADALLDWLHNDLDAERRSVRPPRPSPRVRVQTRRTGRAPRCPIHRAASVTSWATRRHLLTGY